MRKNPVSIAILASAILCLGQPLQAQATVIGGSSSAYGESVSVSLNAILATLSASSGPLPQGSGVAPAPYTFGPTSVASVSVGVGVPGNVLTTNVLSVQGASNVDGAAGNRTAGATATVDGLTLLISLLTATTVQSTAGIGGDYGALSRSGATIIEGLTFGNLVGVNLTPAANTVLFNALGLTITLNEQINSGDGIGSAGIVVNAIHVDFANFIFGTGLLNGDIIISHSEAALLARPGDGTHQTPEPATLLLMAGALMGLGFVRRARSG